MRTLVINKSWMAVGNVCWKDAFRLLCAERAEVLRYYETTVKTPSKNLFIPAVIRLLNFDKLPRCKITYSRRTILERDNYKCQYCSQKLTIKTATLDHVTPRAKGGRTTFENTVASCMPCNNKKGDRLLRNCPFKLNRRPCKPEKIFFRLRLNRLEEEWEDYLPEKVKNEFQTNNRNT